MIVESLNLAVGAIAVAAAAAAAAVDDMGTAAVVWDTIAGGTQHCVNILLHRWYRESRVFNTIRIIACIEWQWGGWLY